MYDIESACLVNPRYDHSSDLYPENVRHRGQAFKGGKAGTYLEGIIDLYDKEGYRITEYNGQLFASLSMKSEGYTSKYEDKTEKVYLKSNPDGSYTVSYLVKTAGIWLLSVTDEKYQHIEGSPFEVEITFGDISYDKSILKCVEQLDYISNYKEFIVQSKDLFGNDAKEGGAKFITTILGGGKLISFTDCKDGKYHILCYLDVSSSFSQLKVTLYGRDIVNSPFDLTTFYKTTEDSTIEVEQYDNLFEKINNCRLILDKNLVISDNFNTLKESLEKMQKETDTSYNAARLKVVHSIPAVFTINEPNKDEQVEKRKQLVNEYKKLNEQLIQIETNILNLQNSKNELNDYLIEKSKTSRLFYKEALDEYNKATGMVLRLTKDTKRTQKFRKNIFEGDIKAFKKLEDERNLEESLKILKESKQIIKSQEKQKNIQEFEELEQEETIEKLNQTIPDRPNTLAFWLMEGRFRPPKKSEEY